VPSTPDRRQKGGTIVDESLSEAHNSFGKTLHYVSLGYRGQQLGLVIDTDDEKKARRQAQTFCISIGARAKVIAVRKVVVR